MLLRFGLNLLKQGLWTSCLLLGTFACDTGEEEDILTTKAVISPFLGNEGNEDAERAIVGNDIIRPFLSLSDIEAPPKDKITKLGEYVFLDKLAEHYDKFLQDDGAGDEEAVADQDQIGRKIGEAFDSIILGGATNDEIVLGRVLDFKGIYEETFNAQDFDVETSLTVNQTDAKIYLSYQCEGVDLSSYHGKSLGDISDRLNELCLSAPTIKTVSQMVLTNDYRIDAYIDGYQMVMEQKSVATFATMNENGGPCTYLGDDDGFFTEDSCLQLEKYEAIKDLIDGAPQVNHGNMTFLKIVSRALKGEKSRESPWFVSGHFESQIENWTGTVTYLGSETPPDYLFTNGISNVRGSLADLPGVSSFMLSSEASGSSLLATDLAKKVIIKGIEKLKMEKK